MEEIAVDAQPTGEQPPADLTPKPASEITPEFYPLDPQFISFSRTTGFIFTTILTLGGLVACLIVWRSQGLNWVTILVLSCYLILVSASAWSSWSWPAIEFRNVKWRLDSTGLEIHRGVFWRHQIAIPIARLQHADISQGPVQRRYGLSKLTIFTAGTSHASIELDGLSLDSATWLRDQLIRQREALDVV